MGGDMPLFQSAQAAARQLIAKDPELQEPEHAGLAEEVRRLFARNGEQGLN